MRIQVVVTVVVIAPWNHQEPLHVVALVLGRSRDSVGHKRVDLGNPKSPRIPLERYLATYVSEWVQVSLIAAETRETSPYFSVKCVVAQYASSRGSEAGVVVI